MTYIVLTKRQRTRSEPHDKKRKHGQPISLFAMSANQCKGVEWLMDTGCGHDLIGRSKATPLGVDVVQDKEEIVFQTANGTTSTSDSIKYYVS